MLDEATKRWLQESYRARAQIASICSGTAALGEAGLLHERRCTTHWEFTSDLQACYPTAQVLEGVLYVQDRGITTSAGITAGIDMALWLLGQECGPRMAAEVTRQLVVYFRRSGLQPQVSVYLQYRSHLDPAIHAVQDWFAEHIGEPASLADLARIGQMSERSLARAFKVAAGITPHQYQLLLRPLAGEPVIQKSAHSGFMGTKFEERLRKVGITTLVLTGFMTNGCVETTARMAGDLGFHTFVVSDGTATFDRTDLDGVVHPAEEVHTMSLVNLHRTFATVVTTAEVLRDLV